MSGSGIAIGGAVNVLLGYDGSWNPADASSSPFFFAPQQGLKVTPVAAADAAGTWGFPGITLHDSAESVLSAIYDFEIVPSGDDSPNTTYPAGSLLTRNANRAAALAALKQNLGIDFDDAGQGFALVEVRREAQTVSHASRAAKGVFRMTGQNAFAGTTLLREIARLPEAGRVPRIGITLADATDVDQYLAFFAQNGTHFISSVTSGDRILQVFAYEAADWAQMKADYAGDPAGLQGPTAYMPFSYYTRPRTPTGGNAAQIGLVVIASNDPAFAATVNAGLWRDDTWSKTNSILAPWLGGTSQKLVPLTQVVPIRIELAPLAIAMPQDRRVAAWRVFRAAMATIYSVYVYPAFPPPKPAGFSSVYPVSQTGLLSMLATPTINTFAQRFDVGSLQLALPEVAESFTLVSNLLEWKGEPAVNLPGSQVLLLSGIVNIACPSDGSVPTIIVADAAYDNFTWSCGAFFGAVFLANASGTRSRLIADGFCYAQGAPDANGRFSVATARDVFTPPPLALVQSASTSLSAAVAASGALLDAWQAMAPAAGLSTITNLLEWVAALIPPGTSDPILAPIRVDALYLARAATALAARKVRQVPELTYAAYQPAVQAMSAVTAQINETIANFQDQIRQRKFAESLVKDLQTINQNVMDTGTLLTGYLSASAEQQQALAASYGDTVATDKEMVATNDTAITALQAQVDDQRRQVSTKIDDYKVAIEHEQVDAIVGLSFDIAEGIFTAGFGLAAGVPSGDDAKALAQIVNDIQKTVALIAAVQQLATAIESGGWAGADAAFAGLGFGTPPAVGSEKWAEFGTRMQNAISKGPSLPEQQDVLTAVAILVARGQALVELQASTATVIADIYRQQRRATIASDQAARLDVLSQQLHPGSVPDLPLDAIDLIGLTGELDQMQSAMMVQLVRAVVLQDLALQYEYLQPPTPPPAAFDVLSVGMYVATQQNALLEAKGALSPAPGAIAVPVDYVIPSVLAASVTGGAAFQFQITTSANQFQPFTMVRVASIEVLVDGIASTSGGQFVVELLYRGQPFYDIDQDHGIVPFSTDPRRMNFLGTVVRGGTSPASAGEPENDQSLVTPFSEWEVSFPDDATNAGLVLTGSRITFTLRFHLVAQINPPPVRLAVATSGRAAASVIGSPGRDVPPMLGAMQGQSCLMGWDAVFSYTEDKINAFLAAEYQRLKGADEGHLVIPLRTDTTTPDPSTGSWYTMTWSMTLGPPMVTFQPGNAQTALVQLDILAATYVETAFAKGGGSLPMANVAIPPPANASISGTVDLKTITGSVNTQRQIVLDLAAGSWEQPTVLTGNPSFNQFLALQLQNVTGYTLGTLDLAPNPITALTPTSFRFNVLTTPSGRTLLQLFITTNGTTPSQVAMNNNDVPEPVPQDCDCSLIISSAIVFQHLLPESFANAGSLLTLSGQVPANSNITWSAAVTAGSIAVPLSINQGAGSEGNIRTTNDSTNVSMVGATVSVGSSPNYELLLGNGEGNTVNIPFQVYDCSAGHFEGMCLGAEWDDESVDVGATITAQLPVTVTGTGSQQALQISISNDSVQTRADIPDGRCTDQSFRTAVSDAFRKAAGDTIPPLVNLNFPSISFFALENLLFPEGNVVSMSAGTFVPGDLVILGNFVQGS